MRRQLRAKNNDVRNQAIAIVGRIGDRASIPVLVALLGRKQTGPADIAFQVARAFVDLKLGAKELRPLCRRFFTTPAAERPALRAELVRAVRVAAAASRRAGE